MNIIKKLLNRLIILPILGGLVMVVLDIMASGWSGADFWAAFFYGLKFIIVFEVIFLIIGIPVYFLFLKNEKKGKE